MNLWDLTQLRTARTGRASSWDVKGRNADSWRIPPGHTVVLADIRGPGIVTHIWMTQQKHYRDCLLKITWDDSSAPSVLCPLGDFFGLGHGMVNSYQSVLFTASAHHNNVFESGCALNCYALMPFRKRALIELVNESDAVHWQYFYVDYEALDSEAALDGRGYLHAEFRRTLPFGGWAPDIPVNTVAVDIANAERTAWNNNYVILETRGRGHYIGCNLSVTNLSGEWWGEGDDMIWVDGYKWPPDLHGTGSEDYFNHAWGMQPNAFLRNGSSLYEHQTGGYQTSYVHHLENPVRFEREIKVTIEHGHGNHLANEMSSVAYWYAERPTGVVPVPPVTRRRAVAKKDGRWVCDPDGACPGRPIVPNEEMLRKKKELREEPVIRREKRLGERFCQFVGGWKLSRLHSCELADAPPVSLADEAGWSPTGPLVEDWFVDIHNLVQARTGIVYLANRFSVDQDGEWALHLGHDGGARIFVDGKAVGGAPELVNPCTRTRTVVRTRLGRGVHEIVVAFDPNWGMGYGVAFSFESLGAEMPPRFPVRIE